MTTTRRIETFETVRSIPLAGQPDSVAVSPSRWCATIVIENERDEDENDGLIPQLPPGSLQILELRGRPERWTLFTVPLTGLADVAPEDPEPEYADINRRDEAIVSLQENNHLVLVVDLRRARVLSDFSAVTIGVGSMVGAGVFTVWAPAAAAAGSGLLVGLAVAALVAFCNASSSARLAAVHPESGGTYVYARHQLGPAWDISPGGGSSSASRPRASPSP